MLPAQSELTRQLISIHGASDILTDVELGLLVGDMSIPPVGELLVVCYLMTDIPVDLWDDVVDPSFLSPV